MPLDRAGAVPGTVDLHVERKAAGAAPARGVLLALAGGPGQSATAFAAEFAADLAPALATHDLVLLDQRGTGRSGYLRCRRAERGDGRAFAAACARELGPAAHLYSTSQSVEDIDSLRQALGLERISLYGVSYGTLVAERYADRYPEHVESLVLDSVLPLSGVDPFELATFQAVPSILRELCGEGRCRGITPDPASDLAWFIGRLTGAGLRLKAVGRNGEPHELRLDPKDGSARMRSVLTGGVSFDRGLRARLPAALRALRRGDSFPLGRLVEAASGGGEARGPLATPRFSDELEFSVALFHATLCEDLLVPWSRGSAVATRPGQVRAALGAIPTELLFPYNRDFVFGAGAFNFCLGWPEAARPPAPDGPGPPDVPILILNGSVDTLTPLANARAVAAQYPRAALVEVPDVGHAVLASAFTDPAAAACPRSALAAFFAGQAVAGCAAGPPRLGPDRLPPTVLGRVGVWPGTRGPAGRVVTAVVRTLEDVAGSSTSFPQAGLRHGLFELRSGFTARLEHVVYVPGVEVSGSYSFRSGAGRLTVRGKFSGTLELARGGRFTGRIGGRAVKGRVPPVGLPR